MGLKAIHILFIAVCLVLGVGMAAWGVMDWRQTGETFSMAACISGIVLALASIPYSFWFVRKLKKVSYL
jgi:hypothetical protein